MRKLAAIASVIAAAAASALPALAPAQQAETTLPELSVTAPKAARPPEWMAPRPGMLGKIRVEEDKWPEIPCAAARIDAMPAAALGTNTCQDGPKVMSAASYMGAGGNIPNAYGHCDISHPLITATIGRFAVEADVLVFDPYKVTADPYNGKCTVTSGFDNLPSDFRDLNQVARRGTAWRNFVGGNGGPGAQSTMEFTDADRTCLALERLGPPWHGGFVWVLHATMCQQDAAPIVQADVDGVISGLHIRVYDPVGNLAPPPRQ